MMNNKKSNIAWNQGPAVSHFAVTFPRGHKFNAVTLKAGLTVLYGGCMEVDTVATGKFFQWKTGSPPSMKDPLGQRGVQIKLTTHTNGKSRVTVTPPAPAINDIIRAWKDDNK